jgi:hypothetical protein
MFKKYFINFWVWWYWINTREVLGSLFRFWLMVLGKLNVVPMLSNLFVPLYQDYSVIGRFVSFVIRFSWSFFGLITFLLIGIPILALALLYLAAPVIVVYQIISFFI